MRPLTTALRVPFFSGLVVLTAILIASFTLVQSPAYTNLDPTDFQKGFTGGNAILLDVRTPEEVSAGSIPGASTIDFYDQEFEQRINLMDKSKSIYVYCRSGGRSAKAAQLLVNNGFKNVYNLQGGITAWQEKGLPVESQPLSADIHIRQMSMDDFNKLLDTRLPVLVDFHTQWCAPCRQMAPVVDGLEKELEGKASVVRIDVDKSKDVGKAYGIKGVPVFVLFKDGKEVSRKTGLLSTEELRKFILQ